MPRILDLDITPVTWPSLVDRVAAMIEGGGPHTIAYANAHVMNVAWLEPELARFLNECCDLVYADGNGVRLAARWLGAPLPPRMTGADWVWDLATEAAEQQWRIFWVGGHEGTAHQAHQRLLAHAPGLQMATTHGFHQDPGAVLSHIEAFAPHIVLVGMGTPTQERWVAQHRGNIKAPVVWCVGAAADFVSGRTKRPGPVWLLENHEWVSRLVAEPGRLWGRYLVGNALFVFRVLGQRAHRK